MAGDNVKEEYFYKWTYGKFIKCGTIQTEDNKAIAQKQKPQE